MKTILYIYEKIEEEANLVTSLHSCLPMHIDIKRARIDSNYSPHRLIEIVGESLHYNIRDKGILSATIPLTFYEWKGPYLTSQNAYIELLKAEQKGLMLKSKKVSKRMLKRKMREGEVYIGQNEIKEFIENVKRGDLPKFLSA